MLGSLIAFDGAHWNGKTYPLIVNRVAIPAFQTLKIAHPSVAPNVQVLNVGSGLFQGQ